MRTATTDAAARLLMIAAPLLGMVSMLLFATFLWTGALNLVDLAWPPGAALAWDGFLSLVFFGQHSGMIRQHFRNAISAHVPHHVQNAVYAIASSLVLTAVVVLWQPTAPALATLEGVARMLARGLYLAAMLGMGWGLWALKGFDPFGRKVIADHLAGKTPEPHVFQAAGPYRWVRHPLYFLALLAIWSSPDITADRLLFNVLWTAWIVAGTVWEEKDLVALFGEPYRSYQSAVPMLIPWKKPFSPSTP